MNILKNQGVAWILTIVMIAAAVGIGYSRATANNRPSLGIQTTSGSCVWDNAQVMSGKTVRELEERNEDLWDDYRATIGVVTCNGAENLGQYALQCAEDMGLGGYDFIVVLDISGNNYWLLQGANLVGIFTDQDCSDYAYRYMEKEFASGDYDKAVLELTEALEDWYDDYFDR